MAVTGRVAGHVSRVEAGINIARYVAIGHLIILSGECGGWP